MLVTALMVVRVIIVVMEGYYGGDGAEDCIGDGESNCSLPLWRVHGIKRTYLAPRIHG
jgi:hypothetical protein